MFSIRDAVTGAVATLDSNLTIGQAREFLKNRPQSYPSIDQMLSDFQAYGGGREGDLEEAEGVFQGKQIIPPPPPLPGDAFPRAGAGGGVDPVGDLRFVGPYVQYLRGRGIPGLPGTAAERFVGQREEDVRNIFIMNQQVQEAREFDRARAVGTDPEALQQVSYEDYSRQFDLAPGGLGTQALSTLQSLKGLTPESRTQFDLSYGRVYDPDTGETTVDPKLGGLQQLIRRGLSATRGGYGAAYIARNLPALRDKFEIERLQGAPGLASSFLGYLQEKYNF